MHVRLLLAPLLSLLVCQAQSFERITAPDARKSAAADAKNLAHAPGPWPTTEQVLDGKIPGRPPAPPVDEQLEPDGFATDRLYHVPPPGQHPRLLFSREDIPRINRQLEATETGRRLKAELLARAEKHRDKDQAWMAEAYETLAEGDADAFQKIWDRPDNPHVEGPPGAGYSPLAALLFYRGLVTLLQNDEAAGKRDATAVATYARWLRPQVEKAATQPGAAHYWLQVRQVAGDFGGLPFLYDFSQPHMAPEQAAEVRGLLELCLRDRYSHGTDLPSPWRNWNHIGESLYFPLFELVLEGETKADPRIMARAREVARDYIHYGITALGSGKESMGYHTGGMAHLAVFTLALANRGDNLFTMARFRRMLDRWMVFAMQPYGREWTTDGDLGTYAPVAPLLQVARFFFPDDPRIALVAGQAPGVDSLDKRIPELSLLQLLAPADLGTDAKAGRRPDFPADLPLAQFDPDRGVLYARSDRTPDALAVQFHARSDTTYPNHDHADRGAFTLSALGRSWAVPSFRETSSQYNSVITIDGVGQGYFAAPARWVSTAEHPGWVAATVDTKYCYDWRWMKSAFFATDEQLAREPFLESVRERRDRLLARTPLEKWERDPSPAVREYFEPWLAGDPRMWTAEDSWVLRTPYNPVEKSFRSLAMVRGQHPFVVIADDIRKDDTARLYEWRMIMPLDVEAHQITGDDIILGPVGAKHSTKGSGGATYKDTGKPQAEPGDPMLLVRILEIGRPAETETTPVPTVETIEFLKHDDVHQFAGRSLGMGRRLVLPSRSVEPRYRVLLFPFRAGEPLPETKWETPEVLAVKTASGTSRVRFAPADDGSTRIALLDDTSQEAASAP
jgi:hypothetical protein